MFLTNLRLKDADSAVYIFIQYHTQHICNNGDIGTGYTFTSKSFD